MQYPSLFGAVGAIRLREIQDTTTATGNSKARSRVLGTHHGMKCADTAFRLNDPDAQSPITVASNKPHPVDYITYFFLLHHAELFTDHGHENSLQIRVLLI
jgi:hypothetical protein